jgi:C1A family cysteine protease
MKRYKFCLLIVAHLLLNGLKAQPLPYDFSWGQKGALPVTFDLREKGRLSPVRTQPAGGCWASAAVSAVESLMKTEGADDVRLSDRHMQLFHGFDPVRNSNGNHHMATAYFSRGQGPVVSDPKTDTLFSLNPPLPFFLREAWYLPNDPHLIKQMILRMGSVYSLMHFRKEQHDTVSNIYYAHREGINHVVTLIGWNDTLQTRVGKGVWIAQNSLGTRFGDQGFFYVPFQDKNILNLNAIWPEWIPFDPKAKILYYDTLGSYHSYGLGDSVCSGMAKFTAHKSGKLTAVATFVNKPGTRVRAWVYSDFDTSTNQLSGLLATTRERVLTYAGYYTIDLDKGIKFLPQDDFYIVMKYTTPGDTLPLPVETYIADYAEPILSQGKNWINPNFEGLPDAWQETGLNAKLKSQKFNLCIRGFFISEEQ